MTLKGKIAAVLAVLGLIAGISLSEAKAADSQSSESLGPGHNQWSPGGVGDKTGAYGTTGKQGVTGSGQFGGTSGTQSGSRMGSAPGSTGDMGSQQEFSGKIQKKGKEFFLMTSDGQQYLLKGDTSNIANLSGKQARVTGTPDPSRPNALNIVSAIPEQKGSMGGSSGTTNKSGKSGKSGGSMGGMSGSSGSMGSSGSSSGQ